MTKIKHPDLYAYKAKTTKASLKKKTKRTGWIIVCFSLLLFFMSYSEWHDLNDMEQTGVPLKKHALVAWLYHAGGKWAVTGGLVLSGIIILLTGFASLNKKIKAIDELEDEK